jgi:hypothetical protein
VTSAKAAEIIHVRKREVASAMMRGGPEDWRRIVGARSKRRDRDWCSAV